MSKTVYQTDRNGVYVGPVRADESPREPGIYLIPAGAVETRPPTIPAGQRARWSDGEWALEGIPDVEPPDPGLTVEERRSVATLPRGTFCSRLRRLGVLSNAEAVVAARGGWPDAFANFTARMSEDEAAEAQIEWAAAQNIRYIAPNLQALALVYADGDPAGATAVLDAIYGIEGAR